MRRRGLLTAIGATSIGGLAGCTGGPVVEETTGTEGGENGGADDAQGTDAGDDDTASEWPSEPYADYDTTRVTVRTPEGETLGTVTAAIARTRDQRYLGLSDATSLPEDAGMLFVYEEPRDRLTFVMREMDFGIDIVYADADGTITGIHNAPAPGPNEDGNEQQYPGSGQYVLEVPYKWTDRNGVDAGDVLAFEL